jgi:hypothetical protein
MTLGGGNIPTNFIRPLAILSGAVLLMYWFLINACYENALIQTLEMIYHASVLTQDELLLQNIDLHFARFT